VGAVAVDQSRKTLRVGLVGAGFMGTAHSLAYSNVARLCYPRLPEIEKVRLADVAPELAQAGAARLGWKEGTGDWRDVTRAADIDIVDIVTPNSTHAEIAVDAARHGKHVFCEKPLSDSAQSASEMLGAASEADVTHQVSFVYRTWPAVALARKLVASREIGDVLQVNVRYRGDYGFADGGRLGWRFEKRAAGGGSLADIGSHAIDIARYLAGDVRRVCARARAFDRGDTARLGTGAEGVEPLDATELDDAVDVLVDFTSGACGVIQTNWCAAGRKNHLEFEVYGRGGSLYFDWQHANELRHFDRADPADRAGTRTIIVGPQHPGAERFWPVPGLGLGYSDAFLIALDRFLTNVASGTNSPPSFLDGLRACEVADAIQSSARSGGWVTVKHASRDGSDEGALGSAPPGVG
jgi:predicted dehydrogenase